MNFFFAPRSLQECNETSKLFTTVFEARQLGCALQSNMERFILAILLQLKVKYVLVILLDVLTLQLHNRITYMFVSLKIAKYTTVNSTLIWRAMNFPLQQQCKASIKRQK